MVPRRRRSPSQQHQDETDQQEDQRSYIIPWRWNGYQHNYCWSHFGWTAEGKNWFVITLFYVANVTNLYSGSPWLITVYPDN